MMTDTSSSTPALYPDFAEPYIDVDEWRNSPGRHRYVHGGFRGTDTRFSVYLPVIESYEGRFFQHITPTPESENLGPTRSGGFDKVGFAFASGAYFLETNGGGGTGSASEADPTIAAYRANAAAAVYSRTIAAEMYGEHRPFGYAYGGSGGAFRTIGGAENTSGVWDGVVPYVPGSPLSIPNVFSVRMHAMRVLRDRLDDIVDSLDAGGSGDPYATLDQRERSALLEVTRMGFPPRSWFGHRTMGLHAFGVLYPAVRMMDPDYFTDFWTEPGYLGTTGDELLESDRVELATTITFGIVGSRAEEFGLDVPRGQAGGVDDSFLGGGKLESTPIAFQIGSAPSGYLIGADLVMKSGRAAGRRLVVQSIAGDIAVLGPNDPDVLADIAPGDEVVVDNTGFLAAQTYHRHQVPSREYRVWDQFRDASGDPIYPQRPMLLGPLFAQGAAGTIQSGRFNGRMIVVSVLLDREAFPWQADWYRRTVQQHLGDSIDDRFRLWYVDNAVHGDYDEEDDPTRTVSYVGAVHQALRDLAVWVEKGVEPLPTSTYEVVDGQIVQPSNGEERGGVQPTLLLTVDDNSRSEVAIGDVVKARLEITVPHGAGSVVDVEWDADGSGAFVVGEGNIDSGDDGPLTIEHEFSFASPGTHIITARVVTQRTGDMNDPYTRIGNLARARVVVS
jgi:hypothetical protein